MVGDEIFINYGDIILEVVERNSKFLINHVSLKLYVFNTFVGTENAKCKITQGGNLHDYSIVYMPNLTDEMTLSIKKDLLEFAVAQEVDAIILSDVKKESAINIVRQNLGNYIIYCKNNINSIPRI